MTYSIVVVNWESAEHLARLVVSMNKQLDSGPELVVVDNASSDSPAEAAKGWKGELRLIEMPENVGYGAGANAGVEAAAGDVVVTLNPDTELVDSGLDALAELADVRRALAGPRLLESTGGPQPSASGPVVGPWPWIAAVWPGALQPPSIRARTEPWRLERTTPVTWLSGACVAGPRELLEDLGPFDPAIHLYGEDMDLGLRAREAGVPSYFCPDLCRVVHHGRGSTSKRWEEGPAEAIERNWRAVARRAYGPRREVRAWRARRLNLALRSVAKRALGKDDAWESALLRAARRAECPELPPAPPARS